MRKAIPCTVMAFTQRGERKLVGTLWISLTCHLVSFLTLLLLIEFLLMLKIDFSNCTRICKQRALSGAFRYQYMLEQDNHFKILHSHDNSY